MNRKLRVIEFTTNLTPFVLIIKIYILKESLILVYNNFY